MTETPSDGTGIIESTPTPERKPSKAKSIRKRKKASTARKKTKTRASSKARSRTKSSRRKSRLPIFGPKTVMARMVKFMQRPQGATHVEMERKFKLDGPDERGRFWHIANDFGFKIKKRRNDDPRRPGRKVFHILASA